jgi:F-type H+-transporting ATPase subunit gamma
MTDSSASLRRQIDSASDLQAVVRTMKAIAASAIGRCESAVRALADYDRTVALGLGACLRGGAPTLPSQRNPGGVDAIVFGSDQGLVGRFNEAVVDHAVATLAPLRTRPRVWAVGERVHARLADAGVQPVARFAVPASVDAIAPLVAQVLVDSQRHGGRETEGELRLVYNCPAPVAAYTTVDRRLLPLDDDWCRMRAGLPWPTQNLPEVVGGDSATLAALIGEYLFVSLFQACADSLASENASRLAAMERAEKNIDDLLERLHGSFHRLRQGGIDEELFDVLAGFEALNPSRMG